MASFGGIITFKGDPDDRVSETEGEENFGGGW
jgi:hypothetical protein